MSITLPEALAAEPKSDFKVMLRNSKTGVVLTSVTDAQGVARLEAEYGTYSVIVSKQIEVEGAVKILSASQNIVLSRDDKQVETLAPPNLPPRIKGTIILKEVYFHLAKTPSGANYNYDQYFTLYNNSDKVQYLDGIGLGTHSTYNSNAKRIYVKSWLGDDNTDPRDSVPISAFGFNFPGKGTDHPLQPGEEVVIALSAINHTGAMTTVPVNLATENTWAMWIPAFKGQKTPEVPEERRLNPYCQQGLGTAFTISRTSPTVVIYRIEGNAEEYVKDGVKLGEPGGHMISAPPAYTGKIYSIMIPKGVGLRRSRIPHCRKRGPASLSGDQSPGSHDHFGEWVRASPYIRKVDERGDGCRRTYRLSGYERLFAGLDDDSAADSLQGQLTQNETDHENQYDICGIPGNGRNGMHGVGAVSPRGEPRKILYDGAHPLQKRLAGLGQRRRPDLQPCFALDSRRQLRFRRRRPA